VHLTDACGLARASRRSPPPSGSARRCRWSP
jgi:hypothetical protein